MMPESWICKAVQVQNIRNQFLLALPAKATPEKTNFGKSQGAPQQQAPKSRSKTNLCVFGFPLHQQKLWIPLYLEGHQKKSKCALRVERQPCKLQVFRLRSFRSFRKIDVSILVFFFLVSTPAVVVKFFDWPCNRKSFPKAQTCQIATSLLKAGPKIAIYKQSCVFSFRPKRKTIGIRYTLETTREKQNAPFVLSTSFANCKFSGFDPLGPSEKLMFQFWCSFFLFSTTAVVVKCFDWLCHRKSFPKTQTCQIAANLCKAGPKIALYK